MRVIRAITPLICVQLPADRNNEGVLVAWLYRYYYAAIMPRSSELVCPWHDVCGCVGCWVETVGREQRWKCPAGRALTPARKRHTFRQTHIRTSLISRKTVYRQVVMPQSGTRPGRPISVAGETHMPRCICCTSSWRGAMAVYGFRAVARKFERTTINCPRYLPCF